MIFFICCDMYSCHCPLLPLPRGPVRLRSAKEHNAFYEYLLAREIRAIFPPLALALLLKIHLFFCGNLEKMNYEPII